MKSLGGELASLAATLAIPAAVACLFPYGATGFRAATYTPSESAVAFVVLNAEEEAAAMRTAKASWQRSRDSTLNIRADLSLGDLPQTREPAVLGIGSRTRQPHPAGMEFKAPPCLPRLAAPPPPPLAPDPPEPDKPTFKREEMLRPGNFGLGVR